MSQKFDWRAEDDDKFEAFDSSDEPSRSSLFSERRWLFLGVASVLVISVGLLAFRQVGRYIDKSGLEVEQEILTSNALVLNAARQADPEILASVLSGRDPEWAEGQLALIGSGVMFDRSPFRIVWQDEQTEVSGIDVAPGLESADVTIQLDYAIVAGPEESESITLSHVLHYRRSNNRWILSAPERGYWSSAGSEEGYYLSIGFPGRDSVIGTRLAADLEGLIAALCNLDGENQCSSDFPIQVSLVADPASIIRYIEPDSRLEGGKAISLPTPSIFGKPGNEQAYQALYRSYGERLVAAVAADQTGWICCVHVMIYQALLDLQLARLGLISWPLEASHFREAVEEPFTFSDHIWSEQISADSGSGSRDDVLTHLLVAYIDSLEHASSIFELQRTLMLVNSFEEWLALAIEPSTVTSFEAGWVTFLIQRSESLEK